MLSANKVKLHGMTSAKWTTKDKITQYKRLIKLYTRDKKIHEIDKGVAVKIQQKELKKLQETTEANRKSLDDAIKGDKQKLRNTLSEHRQMQLAYQYANPEKVIDIVEHVNFNKRKSRDLLLYKKKIHTNKLVELKLRYAELEDIVQLQCTDWQSMLPSERQAQIITSKVQDAILIKEAAIVIRHSYKEMIAIMKKDALYFDAILDAIKIDGINQGKCMINATKLGQLATEYLDDRRQEFGHLEKIVRRDLALRRKDLDDVTQRVNRFSTNITKLLRRDNDINLGQILTSPAGSLVELRNDLKEVEVTLTYLKNAVYVANFDSIYPCLVEQLEQKDRLVQMVEIYEKNRDELLKKTNYATVNRAELENTMVATTFQYKQDKLRYREELDQLNENIRKLEELLQARHCLMANIQIGLKHFLLLADLVSDNDDANVTTMENYHVNFDVDRKESQSVEPDAISIVSELIRKFTKLAQHSENLLKDTEREQGFIIFEHLMHKATESECIEVKMSEESLIEGEIMDTRILSRDDIKRLSEEIVQANTASDDFLPVQKSRQKL